jgi:hypothetical protein
MSQESPDRPERPFEFRTNVFLYILMGLAVALLIHFIVLSSPTFNWIS